MKKIYIIFLMCLLMLTGCTQLESILEETGVIESNQPSLVETFNCDYYFYTQFSDEEKIIYDEFLEGVQRMDKSIKLSTTDDDLIRHVSWAVIYDHPELFWYNGGYTSTNWFVFTQLQPKYTYDYETAKVKQQEIQEVTSEFLSTLPENMSDYETIKYVFDYIVDSVDYNEEAEDHQSIYSALVNQESVCAGYAKSCQYLLQALNMECLYVYGDVTGGQSHAWNIVKCDGVYYQIDSTHGDRQVSEDSTMPSEMITKYIYLCLDDEEMYKNRTVLTDFNLPECSSDDLNYYRLNGHYFEKYDEETLKALMRQDVYAQKTYFECQFACEEDFQKCVEAIRNNVYSRVALDYLVETKTGRKASTTFITDDTHYIVYCWYHNL